MSRFIIPLLIVSLLLVVGLRFLGYREEVNSSNYEIIEKYISSTELVSRYDQLLLETFEILADLDDSFSNIEINEPYADGKIILVVFDGDALGDQLQSPFSSVAGGMLAVGDRYILVDSSFLDLLITNAAAEFAATIETQLIRERQFGHVPSYRRVYYQYKIRSVANISAWRHNFEALETTGALKAFGDFSDPKEKAKILDELMAAGSDDSLSQFILKYPDHSIGLSAAYLRPDDVPVADYKMELAYALPLAGSLFFPIAHELSHLNRGEMASFAPGTLVSDAMYREQLSNEIEADKFALSLLEDALESNKQLEVQGVRYDVGRSALLTSDLFRDMSLVSRIEGLRGLNAHALGTFIDFRTNRNCDPRYRRGGYFDQEDIYDVLPDFFPILTVEEWSVLKGNAIDSATLTHPHETRRALPLQERSMGIIRRQESWFSSPYSQLSTFLTQEPWQLNDVSLLEAYSKEYDDVDSGSGIYASPLRHLILNAGFHLVEAAVCPFDACEVFEADETTIEVGYRDDLIVYLAYYAPAFIYSPDQLADYSPFDAESVSEVRMGRIFSFLQTLVGYFSREIFPDEPLNQEAGQFVRDLSSCGGGSFWISNDAYSIRASTLDEQYSFKLTFLAGQFQRWPIASIGSPALSD